MSRLKIGPVPAYDDLGDEPASPEDRLEDVQGDETIDRSFQEYLSAGRGSIDAVLRSGPFPTIVLQTPEDAEELQRALTRVHIHPSDVRIGFAGPRAAETREAVTRVLGQLQTLEALSPPTATRRSTDDPARWDQVDLHRNRELSPGRISELLDQTELRLRQRESENNDRPVRVRIHSMAGMNAENRARLLELRLKYGDRLSVQAADGVTDPNVQKLITRHDNELMQRRLQAMAQEDSRTMTGRLENLRRRLAAAPGTVLVLDCSDMIGQGGVRGMDEGNLYRLICIMQAYPHRMWLEPVSSHAIESVYARLEQTFIGLTPSQQAYNRLYAIENALQGGFMQSAEFPLYANQTYENDVWQLLREMRRAHGSKFRVDVSGASVWQRTRLAYGAARNGVAGLFGRRGTEQAA